MKKTVIFMLLTCALFCSGYASTHEGLGHSAYQIPGCLRDFGVTPDSTDKDLQEALVRARLVIYSTGFEIPIKKSLYEDFKKALAEYKRNKKTREEPDWVFIGEDAA